MQIDRIFRHFRLKNIVYELIKGFNGLGIFFGYFLAVFN